MNQRSKSTKKKSKNGLTSYPSMKANSTKKESRRNVSKNGRSRRKKEILISQRNSRRRKKLEKDEKSDLSLE